MRGIRPSEIPVKEALRMSSADGRPLALFDTVMPATPSGKVELVSDTLAERWGPEARLAAYRPRAAKLPLSLISPASDKRISSTLLGLGGKPGEAPPLLVNPVDAECAWTRKREARARLERAWQRRPTAHHQRRRAAGCGGV